MGLWVAEIKIRARRRIGEISSKLEKRQANQHGKSAMSASGQGKRKALAQAGLSHSVANRCEKIAEIPEEKFEQVIASTPLLKVKNWVKCRMTQLLKLT